MVVRNKSRGDGISRVNCVETDSRRLLKGVRTSDRVACEEVDFWGVVDEERLTILR